MAQQALTERTTNIRRSKRACKPVDKFFPEFLAIHLIHRRVVRFAGEGSGPFLKKRTKKLFPFRCGALRTKSFYTGRVPHQSAMKAAIDSVVCFRLGKCARSSKACAPSPPGP